MKYFLENFFTFQPQNLISEAVWLGWIIYVFLVMVTAQDIFYTNPSWTKRIAISCLVIFIPFLGILSYAIFCILAADSPFKHSFESGKNHNS